jgi:hypothetical protein
MSQPKPLYSFHAFLFPFEWKPIEKKGLLLEEQTSLDRVKPIMDSANNSWKQMEPWSKPTKLVQYNEANYFYDFVRTVLYGDKDSKYQVHYQHQEAQGGEYIIHLKNGTSFHLELDAIGLSFYSTGVGIISFHCYNREYTEKEAILKINQYGRRLYPPFFTIDSEKVSTQAFFDDENWENGLQGAKDAELAQAIVLVKDNNDILAAEDFGVLAGVAPGLKSTPGLLQQLLPSSLLSSLYISPVLDDRMFVVCWYGNDVLADSVKTRQFGLQSDDRDWWYKFVFVDGGYKTCQNESLTRQLLREHSNLRWGDFGTLYGVSRYSIVCLTKTFATNEYSKIICAHLQTHYFKLAELALLQRGCVMRFSDEVTDISDLYENKPAIGAPISSLYKQYIRFVNKIYFREVTAQEQGIELYDMLQKHMRIAEQVKSLDNEIEELHNYAMLIEEDRRNATLDILTYIGAFFVVPSFVCSYLGIAGSSHAKPIEVGGLCIASALLFFGIIRNKGFLRGIFLIVGILLMLYILFFIPLWR